ncbi:head GIN domain-containing protein [Algibacter miyuki]|uniref:Head GIN domain-containing protein n=1 Tax=Algibacter miyuki TaxID=1306933 RepID=A0ABV5GZS5_9FLAO|nr:head GIN domain-containing protein [Algibacter miyuki]MDN3666665.1 head GIN domain-containing protein [Algibacter miyuki]
MRKLLYILVFSLILACDSENASDCFQKTGAIIEQEISLEPFTKILVNRDVELIVTEGDTQKVTIETGANLINDVEAVVTNGQLVLTDNNTCNYVRDYGITKVYITSPNIIEIRSSTQYDVSSNGVLTYPSLTILSEDFGVPDSFTSGNFKLQVDNTNFRVVFNNISNAFISGKTQNLNVVFAAGTSRFEGRDLVAQNVNVSNRSSNDMVVNPQESLTGKISGIGDVISVNKPNTVTVEEIYKGRLIFE